MPYDSSQEIKQIIEITSRVDERVRLVQDNQQETNERLNELTKEVNILGQRVAVIESKNGGKVHEVEEDVQELEIRIDRLEVANNPLRITREKVGDIEVRLVRLEDHRDNWMAKVKQYSGLILQGVWVIIVCYLLYILKLSSPPLP